MFQSLSYSNGEPKTQIKGKTMTQGPNKIFDDFAKLMTDAADAAQGVRREAETAMQSQFERFLNKADLVKRDEFDAVRDMAAKAREENDALLLRIEKLEAQLATKKSPPAKRTRSRKASDE